jgi:hypothetical protein
MFFTWLTSNVAGLSIIGAAVTFIWSVIQFIITRRRDLQFREFEAYHRLMKDLLSGERVDHQAAIIFELRRFPAYYEFSARMLRRLRADWAAHPASKRLIEEIDLTLAFVSKKMPNTALEPTPTAP